MKKVKVVLLHTETFGNKEACLAQWEAVNQDTRFTDVGFIVGRYLLVQRWPEMEFVYPYKSAIYPHIGDKPAIVIVLEGKPYMLRKVPFNGYKPLVKRIWLVKKQRD